MAVELSTTQFQVCQEANGQFCSITTPFQPLANPPLCVLALYARSPADITSKCSLQIRKTSDADLPTQISPDVWILMTPLSTPATRLPMACSATSPNFYLPPRYQTSNLDVNVSLNMAKPSHD